MPRRTRLEAEEREAKVQETITDVKSKRYRPSNQAVIELNVLRFLVCYRLNEIQLCYKARQIQQHLLYSEERECVV